MNKEKHCPFCGAALPVEAVFCPFCAQSINSRQKAALPVRIPARPLRAAAYIFLTVLLILSLSFSLSPQTCEGTGEVCYTDSDGTYQLLLSSRPDRYAPMDVLEPAVTDGQLARIPLYLYINHLGTGADASGIFASKIAESSLTVRQPADSPDPIEFSACEPSVSNPEAAQVCYLTCSQDSAGPAQAVWTLNMKNGDVIRLRSDLQVVPLRTLYYDSRNADLSDSAALQAFMDQIARETRPEDVISIQLPAVVYTEPLTLPDRSFLLTGSELPDSRQDTSEIRRTTFACGVQMTASDPDLRFSTFSSMDFAGTRKNSDTGTDTYADAAAGTGLSAAGRVRLQDCRFLGWETAVSCLGRAWVSAADCAFIGNTIGLLCNSSDPDADDPQFTANTFASNAIAVLLEHAATPVVLDFSGSHFTGNGTDIENRCGQPLDIALTVFQ